MEKQCLNDGCHCEPQADGFCSDACRNGKMASGHCGCGHDGCP